MFTVKSAYAVPLTMNPHLALFNQLLTKKQMNPILLAKEGSYGEKGRLKQIL